ncbi:oxygen-independent coproporphyrinogen-3 oxidase [Pustulibacterium marinum]|uniref:Heme chaperone HemW n=1 Tax=Pustulibacterium marinum TaxID=1224947 RepID=A0A1I7I5X1_9FLAO|nr:radical SAM family heme chaperone HemW [Pustulibacterium marinum]SFU68337.1 oxygen-independent coproporphyrinogen-3 oxidase [Pustulibacterium marinum]
MAGIYIHIPFCKQACHYCDFHFSTSLKKKEEMIAALKTEILLRKSEFANETVATIYFGGGTPSILSVSELDEIIQTVYENYAVVDNPEITVEANPDDLSFQTEKENIFEAYKAIGVNRLSIGVQSFFEEDLKLMNRAHNADEAMACIKEATQHFDNITIDLIYGIPNMSNERWLQNVQTALDFGIPHISSYALTVEPKTALDTFIKKGIVPEVEDEVAQAHFELLVAKLAENGFVHYELSNFGKEGFFSENNTAYWLGKKYIGIGPSAHSYDGVHRSWNVANNTKYIKAIQQNELPSEIETLSVTDRYNEAVMTGLRTIWGVSLTRVEQDFGTNYKKYLLQQAEKHIQNELLLLSAEEEDVILKTTAKGKFLADGLASDLFLLN